MNENITKEPEFNIPPLRPQIKPRNRAEILIPHEAAKKIGKMAINSDNLKSHSIEDIQDLMEMAKKHTKLSRHQINGMSSDQLLAELRGMLTPDQHLTYYALPNAAQK